MFNHKKFKNLGKILACAAIFGQTRGTVFVNNTYGTMSSLNSFVAPKFKGIADKLQNQPKGKYNVLTVLQNLFLKLNLKDERAFVGLTPQTLANIRNDFAKYYGIIKDMELPTTNVFSADNEAITNTVGNMAIIHRCIWTGINFDQITNNFYNAQRDQTHVYIMDNNILARANDSLSNSMEAYVSRNEKHHVVYAVQSSVKAVMYEIAANSRMPIKVTGLLKDLCAERPGTGKGLNEITNDFVQNLNAYTQQLSAKARDIVARNSGSSDPYALFKTLMNDLLKSGTVSFINNQLEKLKRDMEGKICDFALVFRQKDGVIHVGIVPMIAGNEVAILDQFDDNGDIDANPRKGGVDWTDISNFNNKAQDLGGPYAANYPMPQQAGPAPSGFPGFGYPLPSRL